MKSVRFTSRLLLVLALSGLLSGADSSTSSGATPAESADLAALRNKAERGNPIAQYNLGLALAQRRQSDADLPEAFVWLTLAAERGSRSRALDALLRELTPAQLAEGRARLADVRASHPAFSTPPPSTPGSPAAAADVPSPALADGGTAANAASALALQSLTEVDEKRQLSQELAAAWKESERLQAELSTARANLEQTRKALGTTTVDRTAIAADSAKNSATTAAKLSAAENESAAARAALAQANARVAELTAAQTRLETERAELLAFAKAPPPPDPELSRVRAQLSEATGRLERAESDLTYAREQASALEASQRLLAASDLKLKDATQRVEKLQQEVTARSAAAAEASARVARQQAELEASTAARDEALARLASASALDGKTKELIAANAELSAKASALLQERTALTERVAALERQYNAGLADAQSRIAELTAAQTRLESQRATLIAATKAPRAPDPELTQLRAQREETSARLQHAEAELAHAREQVSASESNQRALAAADLKLHEAAQQTDALKKEIAARNQAATDAIAKITELQSRVSRQQAELDTAIVARDQASAKAGNTVAKDAAAQQLAAANAELTAKLANAAQERTTLAERNLALERERTALASDADTRRSAALAEANSAKQAAATAQASLAVLNVRVAELTSAQKKLESENASLLALTQAPRAADPETARLRQELQDSTTRLQRSDADLVQAREHAAALDATQRLLAASEIKLRDAAEQTETLKKETATRTQASTAAAAQVTELQSRFARQQTELDAATAARDQALAKASSAATTDAKTQQLAASNADLTAKLAAAAQERSTLTERIGAMEKERNAAVTAGNTRLTELTQELANVRRELLDAQQLAASNRESASKLVAATAQTDEQGKALQQLGTEKAALASRVTTLERDLETAHAEAPARLTSLQRQLDSTQRDAVAAKHLVDQSAVDQQRSEQERAGLTKKYEELVAAQSARETELQRLRASVASAESAGTANQSAAMELANARRELAASQSARAEMEAKLRTAAGDANASIATIAKLTAAREALAARVATAESGASETTKLRDQLAKLSARDAATSTELKTAMTRVTEIGAENQQLRTEIAKLESDRTPDLRAELAAAQRSVEETQQKLNATAAELAGSRQQAAAQPDLTVRVRQLESENATLTAKLAAPQPAAAPTTTSPEIIALQTRAETAERATVALQAELTRTNQLLAGERTARRLAAAPTRPTVATATAVRNVTAAAAPATPPPAPTPRTHTIAFGDTLSGISLRYYGTANRWREIFAANRAKLRDESTLVAGRVLEIP